MKEYLEEQIKKTKDDIKYWEKEMKDEINKNKFGWMEDNLKIWDRLTIELRLLETILEKLEELGNESN